MFVRIEKRITFDSSIQTKTRKVMKTSQVMAFCYRVMQGVKPTKHNIEKAKLIIDNHGNNLYVYHSDKFNALVRLIEYSNNSNYSK